MEEEIKMKTESEKLDKKIRADKEQRRAARRALMPMHRTLPDFVELNEQRCNFYDNPANEARLVEGFRFMKKIKPQYVNVIPQAFEMVQRHDIMARAI